MKGDRERFIQAGMDDYLTKPIVRPQLLRILDGLADLRHSPAATTSPEGHDAHSEQKSAEGEQSRDEKHPGPGLDKPAPVLDKLVLEALADQLNQDELIAVIDSFIEDAGKRMDQVEKAQTAGDIEALEDAAHAMRSMGATFGVTSLAKTFGEIEELCIAGNGGAAMDLANTMDTGLEVVFSSLKEFVSRSSV